LVIGKANSVKDSDKSVRSVSTEIPIPLVIYLPNVNYVRAKNPPPPTRRNVFSRDKHTCVYCGSQNKNNLTLDHVIPKNRWKEINRKSPLHYGINSWQNLTTACRDCNAYKSDHLLSELGWPEIRPKAPLTSLDIQWDLIMES
jgi:5-methylcytosine-specific restriction endonuclease McrA